MIEQGADVRIPVRGHSERDEAGRGRPVHRIRVFSSQQARSGLPSAEGVSSHVIICSAVFILWSNVSVCVKKNAGKLAVLGSCHMFSDQYLDKEENSKIMVGYSAAKRHWYWWWRFRLAVFCYCSNPWPLTLSNRSSYTVCVSDEPQIMWFTAGTRSSHDVCVAGCCVPVAHDRQRSSQPDRRGGPGGESHD